MGNLGGNKSKLVQTTKPMVFAQTITRRRESLGLTQLEVSKRLSVAVGYKVSRRMYQRIEYGGFSERELLEVLRLLGLEITIRVSGSDLYRG